MIEYDASKIEPQVAFPHIPSNTRPISQVGNIAIDQVVIGSCTNGRMEDLRLAARVLKGRKVDQHIRCIIIPGSQQVYLDAMKEGLIETFIKAGAVVSTPTCGPCLGGYMGILAAGEKCVSTTNRNFVGRMGHVKSEVYLANPAVAAASAILGQDRKSGGDSVMTLKGKVFKYGDNVDTDAIIPARYLNLFEPADLAAHCMEDIDADFVNKVKPGDIIVADIQFRLRLFP